MNRRFIALALIVLVPIAIRAKDLFPAGCVDCHIKEHRISVLLKAPTMKKKHPPVATQNIPASCMKCHAATSKTIPPLAPLMHRIHLVKGDASEFVKKFGGDCTHCHKLNRANGTWSLPSGAER